MYIKTKLDWGVIIMIDMLRSTVLEKSLCFSQKMLHILCTPKGTDSVQHYLCTDLRIYIESDQVGGGGNIFMNLHQKWSFGIWCQHQNWYLIVRNWDHVVQWIAVTCCTALRSYGYITEAFFLFSLSSSMVSAVALLLYRRRLRRLALKARPG